MISNVSGGLKPIQLISGSGDINVIFANANQTMEGFGGSETYLGLISDANMDLLYTTSGGIGLTFMRVGIATNGGTMGTWGNITKAVARGAKINALPWSPPGNLKDSGITNGGHLLSANYNTWATTLAGFQANMIANTSGVTALNAISVQSEPDFETSAFDSCPYTLSEYVAFWKVLGPKIAALTPRPKMIAADTATWGNCWTYADAILADGTAAPYADYAAGHQYGGMSTPIGNWTDKKWMTEYSTFDTYDGSMANGIGIGQAIHDAIVGGGASAWMWWWLVQSGQADNEGLIDTVKGIPKRYYVLGNFSKFVRPGYVRVSTSGTISGISLSAYKSGNNLAIVAVNTGGGTSSFNIGLQGLTAGAVTPYLTDATHNLAAQTNITVTGNVIPVSLPGTSVTTFIA